MTGDDRNQKPNQDCLDDVSPIQELTSKKYLLKHRLRLFDAVITPTTCYVSETCTSTEEHERMIQSTQNAPTHHTNEKKTQKDRERKRQDNEEKDTNDISSTDDESDDGQSSSTHKDQDSDMSFENDTEKEIDTTKIEAEDWTEYVKRNTDDAIEKMGKYEDPMLQQDSQKNEMETDAEDSKISE